MTLGPLNLSTEHGGGGPLQLRDFLIDCASLRDGILFRRGTSVSSSESLSLSLKNIGPFFMHLGSPGKRRRSSSSFSAGESKEAD